jgi:imidazolonepropionase-like amidohydrolase
VKGKIMAFLKKILKKDLETGERQRQSFSLAVKQGIKLAYGTDSGVYPHGDNAKQFSRMTTYGMSPLEAIQSATTGASELLGLSEKIGQINAGYYADIIAVNENPLDRIETLEEVIFVMKNGQVFKGPNQ